MPWTNQLEDWVKDKLEKSGIKFLDQTRIEIPKLNVTGYSDFVVEIDGKKMVVELKSKHSRAFWYMTKSGTASYHQKMQLWTYLYALNIEEGRLVYISKDDLAIQEYIIKLNDEDLKKSVLEEFGILNRAWKEELPPEPTKDKKDWRYKYSSMHEDHCLKQKEYLSELHM